MPLPPIVVLVMLTSVPEVAVTVLVPVTFTVPPPVAEKPAFAPDATFVNVPPLARRLSVSGSPAVLEAELVVAMREGLTVLLLPTRPARPAVMARVPATFTVAPLSDRP